MEDSAWTFDVTPNWEPLEKAVAPVYLPDFMHMGRIGTIELYKYRNTRRYLNIEAATGQFFEYKNGMYTQIDPESAMRWVLQDECNS